MKKLIPWFSVAVILVIVFGTIYTVVQQGQRRDANYPQIQIAKDTAAFLNQGRTPQGIISNRIDMAKSLAPFIIIYNKSGQVIAGSGYLNGKVPTVPYGVLTAAKGKTDHIVTWQPQSGVRIAAVSVAANHYYVLSGRSLTEVEKNENLTFLLSMLGGLASLLVLSVAYKLTRP